MRIGEIIKEKRKELELTQEELANKLHVTRQAISNWENNKSVPDIEFIRQLADEFEMSIDELLLNDVKRIEKKTRTNHTLILITMVATIGMIVLFASSIVRYFTFSTEAFAGRCTDNELGVFIVNEDDSSYIIDGFEEILFENYYCVPITYTIDKSDLINDGEYIEERFVHIDLPAGFEVFVSQLEYNKTDTGFVLDVFLQTTNKNDDIWQSERMIIVDLIN